MMTNWNFTNFMSAVGRIVMEKEGLGVDDLSDYAYHEAFVDERTPEDVADEVIAENRYPH